MRQEHGKAQESSAKKPVQKRTINPGSQNLGSSVRSVSTTRRDSVKELAAQVVEAKRLEKIKLQKSVVAEESEQVEAAIILKRQHLDWQETESFQQSLSELDDEKILKECPRVQPRGMRGRPKIGERVTIVLPEEMIEQIKTLSAKKGLGYQTMIRVILTEKLGDYDFK